MKRTCSKCGSEEINYQYLHDDDRLRLTCSRCEYTWQEDPLDKTEDEDVEN